MIEEEFEEALWKPAEKTNNLPRIVAVLSVKRGDEVAINTHIDDYSGSWWKCSASLLISDSLWVVSRWPGGLWGTIRHKATSSLLGMHALLAV